MVVCACSCHDVQRFARPGRRMSESDESEMISELVSYLVVGDC